MMYMLSQTVDALLTHLPALLANLPEGDRLVDRSTSALTPLVDRVTELGMALLVLGMVLCLYRIKRGPHLADRVLASDALALHVVGLVVVLAIYQNTTAFLDVALVVAIIGFAGTLALAQYIGAKAMKREKLES